MNRLQLFDAFRSRAHDIARPYLWSDDELLDYLDDAHNEAAERGKLLRDTQTSDICEVAIVIGTARYELDARIIEVTRAKLDVQTTPLKLTSTILKLTSTLALDREFPDWESRVGNVGAMAVDPEGAGWTATLVGSPTAAGTLRLQVFRLPLESLNSDTAEPEINPRLHIRLVDWMLYRAYSKKDAETSDEKKGAEHADDFTMAFGVRTNAGTRRTQHDRSPAVVEFREY